MAKDKKVILNKQQLEYLDYYFNPKSKTRGNALQSALKAGYSQKYAENITYFTPNWLRVCYGKYADRFPDEMLFDKHLNLLDSTRLDHMVFPVNKPTDKEITEMLTEVNCKVRKIIHGETARHVYFWSADNKAREKGLEMAYKIKGAYAPEKKIAVTFNVDANLKQRAKKAISEIVGR